MATFFEVNEVEIEAAESLLVLPLYQTKKETLNSKFRFFRWGSKKRRSIPQYSKIEENEEETKKRLSPSTPLSFSPSGSDPCPPPPPPPPPKTKVFNKMEQHKAWVKEQNQKIATLSVTNASLQHSLLEAKRRYQLLRETNSWLKELQYKWREALMAQQGGGGRRSWDSDLYSVDSTSNQRLDLNQSLDLEAEAAVEWRRRMAAYAAARKKRIELQRGKSSLKIQRLR